MAVGPLRRGAAFLVDGIEPTDWMDYATLGFMALCFLLTLPLWPLLWGLGWLVKRLGVEP